MKHVFWLVDNELCGRPGPNHEPWNAAELRESGIGAILSVNSGESVYLDELEPVGIAYKCIPLAAPVLAHCRHGKDRTGLFMAYYLKHRFGLGTEEAIQTVKAKRSIALTAQRWDEFAVEVLNTC